MLELMHAVVFVLYVARRSIARQNEFNAASRTNAMLSSRFTLARKLRVHIT